MPTKQPNKYSKEEGSIPIYSYGTTPVWDTISHYGEFNKFYYDVIIIDATTIIRNIASDHKDLPYYKLKPLINEELGALMQAIAFATKNSGMINVKIIIYLANYVRNIKEIYLKTKYGKLNSIVHGHTLQELKNPDKNRDMQLDDNTILQQRMIRHGNVIPELRMLAHNAGNRSKILLLSHMPYSYHLTGFYPDMHLIYSHTGEIHDRSVLPKKVFKHGDIPFYNSTHLFFGDSIFLKGIASNKQKKIAKQKAIDDSWITQQEAYVIFELEEILKNVT